MQYPYVLGLLSPGVECSRDSYLLANIRSWPKSIRGRSMYDEPILAPEDWRCFLVNCSTGLHEIEAVGDAADVCQVLIKVIIVIGLLGQLSDCEVDLHGVTVDNKSNLGWQVEQC